MKKTFLLALLIISAHLLPAQTVTWGKDFTITNGSTDFEVIGTDNSGVYVQEAHLITASTEAATLIKLDKDLSKIFQSEFNKQMKDKDFERFFFLKEKLFLLASGYEKKNKTLVLFAAEVDKGNGNFLGDWQAVTSWQKEEKKDEIDFKADYSADSTKMIVVSSLQSAEGNNYELSQYDEFLKPVGKTTTLTNTFERGTFFLEDIVFPANGNVILVGRVHEYQEGKSKKSKFLQFKNYSISIYNNEGKKVKDINTSINGKWLLSSKVFQTPGKELGLAAFYSNDKNGKKTDGLLVQKINAETGEIIATSNKDLIAPTASGQPTDDGPAQEKEEGFSKYLRFRKIISTHDKGIIILAEEYENYASSSSSTSFNGSSGSSASGRTYDVHESGNLMMAKLDAAGNISWLNVLPKFQKETILMSMNTNFSGSGSTPMPLYGAANYLSAKYNRPFYSGFNAIAKNNMVYVIFNDSKSNANVVTTGQPVSVMTYQNKPDCYLLTLDATTGKCTRSLLFSNDNMPVAMPRLGAVLGNNFYLIGKTTPMIMFSRPRVAAAKISFAD